MACTVTAEPVWWPNGAAGLEIRCQTCSRVLWQSGPDQPYDASEAFVRSVADGHQAEMDRPENPAVPRIESSPQAFVVDLGAAGSTEPENTDE